MFGLGGISVVTDSVWVQVLGVPATSGGIVDEVLHPGPVSQQQQGQQQQGGSEGSFCGALQLLLLLSTCQAPRFLRHAAKSLRRFLTAEAALLSENKARVDFPRILAASSSVEALRCSDRVLRLCLAASQAAVLRQQQRDSDSRGSSTSGSGAAAAAAAGSSGQGAAIGADAAAGIAALCSVWVDNLLGQNSVVEALLSFDMPCAASKEAPAASQQQQGQASSSAMLPYVTKLLAEAMHCLSHSAQALGLALASCLAGPCPACGGCRSEVACNGAAERTSATQYAVAQGRRHTDGGGSDGGRSSSGGAAQACGECRACGKVQRALQAFAGQAEVGCVAVAQLQGLLDVYHDSLQASWRSEEEQAREEAEAQDRALLRSHLAKGRQAAAAAERDEQQRRRMRQGLFESGAEREEISRAQARASRLAWEAQGCVVKAARALHSAAAASVDLLPRPPCAQPERSCLPASCEDDDALVEGVSVARWQVEDGAVSAEQTPLSLSLPLRLCAMAEDWSLLLKYSPAAAIRCACPGRGLRARTPSLSAVEGGEGRDLVFCYRMAAYQWHACL